MSSTRDLVEKFSASLTTANQINKSSETNEMVNDTPLADEFLVLPYQPFIEGPPPKPFISTIMKPLPNVPFQITKDGTEMPYVEFTLTKEGERIYHHPDNQNIDSTKKINSVLNTPQENNQLPQSNENIDEIMSDFSGVYRNSTGSAKKIPKNSILNAPCFADDYGNVVVDTTNNSPDLAQSCAEEVTITTADKNIRSTLPEDKLNQLCR